ncbi:MAG: DUF3574 domain-containing protein [Arenimonas sp.]
MQAFRAITITIISVAISGCASAPKMSCRGNEQRAVHDMLYLGTGKPNGVVTSEEWAKFLETVVTPRFSDGLTVFEASGQWRDSSGTIIRESTHVLQLVHPDDPASEKSVIEIAASYKTQFQQEAVLRVRKSACVTF